MKVAKRKIGITKGKGKRTAIRKKGLRKFGKSAIRKGKKKKGYGIRRTVAPLPVQPTQGEDYNKAYDAGFDSAYNEGFDVGYAEGMAAGNQ